MALEFMADNRLYVTELNNMAFQLLFRILSGCSVTQSGVPAMTVDVAGGSIIFNGATVTVLAQPGLVIAPSDPSNDRIDIVLVDSMGVCTVLTGTPAVIPKTPLYDPELYLCLARVLVEDGSTTVVNSKITDQRVILNLTLASGVASYTEVFTSQTSVTVSHGLADDKPIVQVYDSANELITPDVVDIVDLNTVQLTFLIATTGYVVVHGGQSAGFQGGVGTYLHKQLVANTTWNVNHNLNDTAPTVQVYDSGGNSVEPQGISITNGNQLVITVNPAIAGNARVLAGKFSGGSGDGDLIPSIDDAYDIGSNAFRWQDLHLSGTQTTNGNIMPQVDATSDLGSGAARFQDAFLSGNIQANGNFLPETHNTSDLGTNAVRFKDGFFQGDLVVGDDITAGGDILTGATGSLFLGVLISDPGTPVMGQVWFNSTDSQFKGYNGTSIIILG